MLVLVSWSLSTWPLPGLPKCSNQLLAAFPGGSRPGHSGDRSAFRGLPSEVVQRWRGQDEGTQGAGGHGSALRPS